MGPARATGTPKRDEVEVSWKISNKPKTDGRSAPLRLPEVSREVLVRMCPAPGMPLVDFGKAWHNTGTFAKDKDADRQKLEMNQRKSLQCSLASR